MPETPDDGLPKIGTLPPVRRRISRRSKPTPMDTRRAPESVADPAAGSAETPPSPDAPPGDVAALRVPTTGITAGVAVIREALRSMPATPGVYRMLDRRGDAVYVGKARNLKSRVQNYTHPTALSNRLRRMVAETVAMEIVVTHTEAEALLLECNLIKRLMPRYNVLLLDDKSLPLIHL